jgi:putative hydrolase of the HAD superfamily
MPLRYLLLDLDKTVYPASSTLSREIDDRMTGFVARTLGVSMDEAHLARTESFPRYGSTIRWLMEEHGLEDPETFLGHTHPEPVGPFLVPDPRVRAALDAIPLPASILTNAPLEHAERVLDFYGIRSRFEQVFDLRFNGYRGKPDPDAYRRVLDAIRHRAEDVLFVDDYPAYLAPFLELGGRVLLMAADGSGNGYPRIASIHELPAYIAAGDAVPA